MEIEFLPREVLWCAKPCFLLCGLNGRSEWAKAAIREKTIHKYNVVEQEQFTPTIKPKQAAAGAKQFNVPAEWIVDFHSRFVVVVELFLVEEMVSVAQIVEDIVFAHKYAHENRVEHLAVVLSERPLPADKTAFVKKSTPQTVFLDQAGVDAAPLLEQLARLASHHYEEVLVKKYKKRASASASRFLNPWSCHSFYCFKSGVAFEASGETGNALRDFHASYSAIIDEGNGLAPASRRAFCEFTRPAVDVIFLRMAQCMLRLGSTKEAEAFLRGHLAWFGDAFSDTARRLSWKVAMFSEYGRMADLLQNTSAAVYYSLATAQAVLLLGICQVGPATVGSLVQQSLLAIDVFRSDPQYRRHMLVEQAKVAKILSLSNSAGQPLRDHIDRLLLDHSFRAWPGLLQQVARIAIQHYPDDVEYVWQYASITQDWETLRARLGNPQAPPSDTLDFPRLINGVIQVDADFVHLVCRLNSPCPVAIRLGNHSNVPMRVSRLLVGLSNGHVVEHSHCFELHIQTTIHTTFTPTFTPTTLSELAIVRVTLILDAACVQQLVFEQGSFSTGHGCQVVLPPARLAIDAQAVTGLVDVDTFAVLRIRSHADVPVQGVLKVTKAPPDLAIAPAFPFGVGANGTNVLRLPMRAAAACTASVHFDVEFLCDGHRCDPMLDLSLPVAIVEPLRVRVECRRRVANPAAALVTELFAWETKVWAAKNAALLADRVTIRAGGSLIGDIDLAEQQVVEFVSKESPDEIAIDYTLEGTGERGEMRVRPPAVPLQQVIAFHHEPRKEILLVNQSGEATVVLSVEKKGPVMTQGPKRLTLTLPGSSITRLPFQTVLVAGGEQPQIALFVDGLPATPDWLVV